MLRVSLIFSSTQEPPFLDFFKRRGGDSDSSHPLSTSQQSLSFIASPIPSPLSPPIQNLSRGAVCDRERRGEEGRKGGKGDGERGGGKRGGGKVMVEVGEK